MTFAPAHDDVLEADLQQVARGSNATGFDLFHKLRANPGNLAFSPASISVAFGMASAGARGETLAELRRVLHFGLPEHRLHAALGTLVRRWNLSEEAPVALAVANRLYGHHTFAFERSFLELTARVYGAALEPVNFDECEAARQNINGWVAKTTRERVRDLIPAGCLYRETRLALVNALYFNGSWAEPFEERDTAAEPFLVSGHTSVMTPTMRQTEMHLVGEQDDASLLDIAYRGQTTSMTILLPKRADGLPALESRLTASSLHASLGCLGYARVSLLLPRFCIEPPESYTLASTFEKLGMRLATDGRRADFSGIAVPPRPGEGLYIGEVFHKAFVAVNEQGTEAAAATAIAMAPGCRAPARPIEFRVDHPFLFLIRDRATGMILFIGRVDDPR